MADYILGPKDGNGDRAGRGFAEIFDFETYGFIHPEGDEDQETYQNVKFADLDTTNMRIYFRYLGDIYYFSINQNEEMTTKDLTLSQDNQGNLGRYVKFSNSNINWIVLSENENSVELISADALGNVELSGKAGYNNAIDTLVTACQNLVKDNGSYISSNILSARSVGGPITDDTETLDENGYKALDTYYLSDYNKMNLLKITAPDNGLGNIYWLASRCKESGHYSIRVWTFKDGIGDDIGQWVEESWSTNDNYVRPVITVNKSAFNNASGTGLCTDPIIIN